MPGLDTDLHLEMLRQAKGQGQPERDGLYGLHWGDPDLLPELKKMRDEFVLPFVHEGQVACEIGPGGGRFTRYLLPFSKIYVVDFYQEMLDEFSKNYNYPNIVKVKNSGYDFPGIPNQSIDYLLSWGTFVHFDLDLIMNYLKEMRRVLKPGANAVIEYSDKTKEGARKIGKSFSDTDPDIMRAFVKFAGFEVLAEDTTSIFHCSVIRFSPAGSV